MHKEYGDLPANCPVVLPGISCESSLWTPAGEARRTAAAVCLWERPPHTWSQSINPPFWAMTAASTTVRALRHKSYQKMIFFTFFWVLNRETNHCLFPLREKRNHLIILSPADQRNRVTSWAARWWLFFQQKLWSVCIQKPKAKTPDGKNGQWIKTKVALANFPHRTSRNRIGGRAGTGKEGNDSWLYNGPVSVRDSSGAIVSPTFRTPALLSILMVQWGQDGDN